MRGTVIQKGNAEVEHYEYLIILSQLELTSAMMKILGIFAGFQIPLSRPGPGRSMLRLVKPSWIWKYPEFDSSNYLHTSFICSIIHSQNELTVQGFELLLIRCSLFKMVNFIAQVCLKPWVKGSAMCIPLGIGLNTLVLSSREVK